MSAMTPPSTPASSIVGDETESFEENNNNNNNNINDDNAILKEGEEVDSKSSRVLEETMKSGNGNSNKRALTLKLKQNSLFHALAKQADENAKRDAEDALRRKRETQNVIRKTLKSQQEQKRLAREKEKMVERMLDNQQRRTAEKLDEARLQKEREKRQFDQQRAREAEIELLKAREERALRKKQDVERAAEFVRKAEEAQEKLDTKREEEKRRRLMLVEAKMAQGDGEGIEKRRMEFLEMEEKRFRLEAKKKIEALEERERREKETRRLNDLKWRESLEAQVAEKEQRELDMAIGNMSLREMQFNGISA